MYQASCYYHSLANTELYNIILNFVEEIGYWHLVKISFVEKISMKSSNYDEWEYWNSIGLETEMIV